MPSAGSVRADRRARRGERFTAIMTVIAGRLPFGLSRIVPPNLVGFAVISATTFSLNIALLIVFHGDLHWPVALSISAAYLAGSGLGYVLNRSLNFRSQAAVVPQAWAYTVVITINYLAWILGVGAGLTALGVDYRLARLIAGGFESVYMYVAMRWLVFRDTRPPASSESPAQP